jgi:hypothetical protein
MKKLLLLVTLIVCTTLGISQVTFIIDPPSVNSGSHTIVDVADQINNGWGTPDMTDPANSIVGNLVLVSDGTGADSLGCENLNNGAALSGNIAVVYRGDCPFGTKALNAQTAGAIGVIIINNVTDDAFSMLGGDDGPSVTIPVIMIPMATGDVLKAELEAGTLSCFIGNKFGYFQNDLGSRKEDILRSNQFMNVQAYSQSETEFNMPTGAWIYNFGQNNQTAVVLNAVISFGGASIYNENSTPIDIASGDSVFVSLLQFEQTTYANGYYTFNYTITSSVSDDFEDDNVFNADFMFSDNMMSYARIDSLTLLPHTYSNTRASNSTSFSSCMYFSNPNASRSGAKGLTFSASTTDEFDLNDEYIEIEAFEWNNAVTDVNDAAFALDDLNYITSAEYTYDGDYQDSMITLLYDEPFMLVDDKNYVFCVSSESEYVYFSYDRGLDYSENIDTETDSPTTNNGHPITIIRTDNGFSMFQSTDLIPALVANFFPASELGINDSQTNEKQAYPNPAVNEITIPLNGSFDATTIKIIDINGKVVSQKNTNLENQNSLKLNVTSIPTGMYVVVLIDANGNESKFNFLVKK